MLGGSRFIGRAIVEAALASYDVTVVNRGTHPLWTSEVHQVIGDRDAPLPADILDGFDVIVDVSATEARHVRAIAPALELTAAPYVYISSAAVYEGNAPPYRKTDPHAGGQAWGHYGTAKSACERLRRQLVDPARLVVLRPPYVYGPFNTEPREKFLWARILAGQPIFVPGDGQTRLQFSYVRDLAAVVLAGAEGRLAPDTYNVADLETLTIREYVAMLASVVGVQPLVVPAPDAGIRARDYFPFRDAELTVEVSVLSAAQVYEPTSFVTGLAETLSWAQSAGQLAY